jgi:hypothetical protein
MFQALIKTEIVAGRRRGLKTFFLGRITERGERKKREKVS